MFELSRVRVLGENSDSTMDTLKRTTDGTFECDRSHAAVKIQVRCVGWINCFLKLPWSKSPI